MDYHLALQRLHLLISIQGEFRMLYLCEPAKKEGCGKCLDAIWNEWSQPQKLLHAGFGRPCRCKHGKADKLAWKGSLMPNPHGRVEY